MIKFLLWCLLLVVCWPLAILALMLWPIVWLISLPFRLLGIAVDGVFSLLRAIVMLPARVLGGGSALAVGSRDLASRIPGASGILQGAEQVGRRRPRRATTKTTWLRTSWVTASSSSTNVARRRAGRRQQVEVGDQVRLLEVRRLRGRRSTLTRQRMPPVDLGRDVPQ